MLGDVFAALGSGLSTVASGPGSPTQKIDGLIEALARGVETHPYFLPMMLRELAEGAPRLGRQTLEMMASIFRMVRQSLPRAHAPACSGRLTLCWPAPP